MRRGGDGHRGHLGGRGGGSGTGNEGAHARRHTKGIIERVRTRLGEAGPHPGAGLRAADDLEQATDDGLGDGVYGSIDEAVAAASRAFRKYQAIGLDGRKVIIAAIREAMLEAGERLAEMAHAETGLGRAGDKVIKNRLVTTKTPGPEDLELEAVTGDHGMMVTEFAPFGVIGLDHPDHQPDVDVINNTISMLSAGNARGVQRPPERQAGVGGEHPPDQPSRRGRRRTGGPGDHDRRADDRERPGADAPPGRSPPPGHRRPGRRPGGAEDRQAGDHRRARQSAGVVDETADIEQAGRDIVRRGIVRQQRHLHRREGTLRGAVIADELLRVDGGRPARTA